jgi:methylase of polypeptide subunit release factors
MRLIKELFLQARTKLKKNGFIFIESDVRQHHALNHFAEQQGFSLMATQGLITLYTSV